MWKRALHTAAGHGKGGPDRAARCGESRRPSGHQAFGPAPRTEVPPRELSWGSPPRSGQRRGHTPLAHRVAGPIGVCLSPERVSVLTTLLAFSSSPEPQSPAREGSV